MFGIKPAPTKSEPVTPSRPLVLVPAQRITHPTRVLQTNRVPQQLSFCFQFPR